MKSAFLSFVALSLPAAGAVVYQDTFDAGTSAAGWSAKLSAADAVADFAFDYNTLGIPSAPNSTGGSTIGMRFLANQSAGVFQGISASPVGQSFTGDFTLSFDMWLNYVGPLGAGGSGTTQLATFGWGTDGNTAQWPLATSSLAYGAVLDGGSTQDYRAYKNNLHDITAVNYAGGSQNNSAVYYTTAFPAGAAPAAQTTIFPGQTGSADAGEVAFRWRDVTIERLGSNVTWKIDGTLIYATSVTGLTLSGSNIFLGLSDTNAGSSTDPNDFLNAAIYDNVRVDAVPEPSALSALLLLGAAALHRRARRADR
jgi:hypothetical protein